MNDIICIFNFTLTHTCLCDCMHRILRLMLSYKSKDSTKEVYLDYTVCQPSTKPTLKKLTDVNITVPGIGGG